MTTSEEVQKLADMLVQLASFTKLDALRDAANVIRKQQATIEAQDALLKAYLEVKA